ncbi:4-diphosphocytidyl-2C-methyl-D-erythritol kinase [Capsulimonas corticalis]|uniref:4-diphosphocytidyl-2-C-methyl-D-erythritol kinase n=1 Tax=Capsulimonas corticalis TaxID=2219043 RepID=A0A402D6X6_9BACT|nr:4-(cytidine 5'-diphospho)-2-C-methyl-D-erythritol kinase [Capsulimonas corticalis]BDI31804.1 4-diphosphocytidyl-2C-methyl-D-erythritol kinase [Capsulimonas corticalis]
MTTPITALAHAKINLTLDVGPRRADGYHEIESIMQTIALHDLLTITPTPDVPGVALEVHGPEAEGVPADPSNIVHKAAVRLQKTAAARGLIPGDRSGLHIILEKNIPSQAGLGGGSSDAAAALRAIDRLFGLHLSKSRLTEIAAALGADVAFFLTGGTALAQGLGERISEIDPWERHWLIVVKPPAGVSTAAAYAALDAQDDQPASDSTQQWLADRTAGRPAALHNDFTPTALATPEILTAFIALTQCAQEHNTLGPLLCGSGSALFVATRQQETAEQIVRELEPQNIGRLWLTETLDREEMF